MSCLTVSVLAHLHIYIFISSTSCSLYFGDLLDINNDFYDQLVVSVYPKELKLNKANASNTEVDFTDIDLSIP